MKKYRSGAKYRLLARCGAALCDECGAALGKEHEEDEDGRKFCSPKETWLSCRKTFGVLGHDEWDRGPQYSWLVGR